MSDDTPQKLRPANLQSREAIKEQAKVIEQRKEDAASPQHQVIPNGSWRNQFALWQNADHDGRCDIVFGMVLHDGAITERDLTRFFNISKDDLRPYRYIFEAGRAALKLKVQRNQISIGLQREDTPTWKFFLGKQFGEQVAEPAHEGVESVESADTKVTINVLKPEDATTVAEQVGTALNARLQ